MPIDYSVMRLTCDQVVAAADAKIPYLIQDYIPYRTIGTFIGDWGVGKSPFVLQTLMSMVSNIPLLGRYPIAKEGLTALYVDVENNANQLKFITTRIKMHLGLDKFPGRELTMIGDAYSPKAIEGASFEGLVRDAVKQCPPDLLVIDPLRGFNYDVETGNDKAAKFIEGLRKLVTTYNVTIMLVHHPRKQDPDPTTPRFHLETDPSGWMANACGAAALIQNVDFRIGIEQLSEDKGGLLAIRRHIRGYGWYPIEYLDRVFDEDNEPLGYVLTANEEDPTLVAHLNNLPAEFTTAVFKERTGLQHNMAAQRAIKKYLLEGKIIKLTKGVFRVSRRA